jgi:hypothetical protein
MAKETHSPEAFASIVKNSPNSSAAVPRQAVDRYPRRLRTAYVSLESSPEDARIGNA